MNEATQALSRAMNWAAVMPEIVLLTMACVIALVDLFVTDEQRRPTFWLTQASLGVVALMHLARVDGEVAGCCALRPLDSADYPNAAEMKRLFVRKAFRGFGLGRQLAEAILDAARQAGYACVLLDTLDDMEAARTLYEDLGFEEIPPYYHNPIPGAHYLKADL